MSQFYAEIEGTRGRASRQGSKKSGIWAHVRGWNIGIEVQCNYDEEKQRDVIIITQTGGSNARTSQRELFRLVEGLGIVMPPLWGAKEGENV